MLKEKLNQVAYIKDQSKLGIIEKESEEGFEIRLLDAMWIVLETNVENVIKVKLTKAHKKKLESQVDEGVIKLLLTQYATVQVRRIIMKSEIKANKQKLEKGTPTWKKESDEAKSQKMSAYFRERGITNNVNIDEVSRINSNLFGE